VYERDEFDARLNAEWSYETEGTKKLTERITSDDDIVWIVEKDSKAVGLLVGSTWNEPTIKEHALVGELSSIYLDPEIRGKGIGTELIQRFKKWAEEKNVTRLVITASSLNEKAIALYKKMGFEDHLIKLRMDL
jgi:ribosomal protein S18 acetylase RimI-like enzyme